MSTSRRAFLGALAALACLWTFSATPAMAASPAFLPIATTGPTVLPPVQSEVQRLAVDADGGSFALSFEGQKTAPIAFDAHAAEVEAALNALPSVEGAGGRVGVKGGAGSPGGSNPYFIAFEESLAEIDVPAIATDSGGLLGGAHTAFVTTSVPGGPGTTKLAIYAQNVGGAPTAGTITLSAELPPGVSTGQTPEGTGWSCTPGAGQSAFSCTSSQPVAPGLTIKNVTVPLVAGPGAGGEESVEIELKGGSAPDAAYQLPLTISPVPAGPGFQSFAAGAFDDEGNLDTRAGAHPYTAMASIMINTARAPNGTVVPVGEFKDVIGDLPPGFLGNPVATPQCPDSSTGCPRDTVIGIAAPIINNFGGGTQPVPIFNIQAPFGYPGKFRFLVGFGLEELSAVGSLRSEEDYGLSVISPNTPQIFAVYGFFFTFWGSPADPSHDAQRCSTEIELNQDCGPSSAPATAFLTNATNCAEQAAVPPVTRLAINTWQQPLVFFRQDVPLPPVTGCEQLEFEGNLSFQPGAGEGRSDSTASFSTDLTIPDEGLRDPDKLMTPTPRKLAIRFPRGLVLNPSAADGLASCSEAQIGLKGANFPSPNRIRFTKAPNTCPDASKIGTLQVKSALLEETLHGALYLADQGEGNPLGSLFAVYLVIEDPRTGVVVKLVGRTDPDPQTGQLTAVFDDNPQLPFTSLKLKFKGGARSPFATPTTCGTFTTETEMTPWSAPESGPPTIATDSFVINSGPGGSACANTPEQRPFDLGLQAGASNPTAGAHSPFTIRITRPDGAQEIRSLDITTPPGFIASLRGIPRCSEAQIEAAKGRSGKEEQASASCPAGSQVGTTLVGAGSGSNPFYAPGKLYLAGPYKGAPLSVVAITPAVAGPFDLGNVLIRSAAHLDPTAAQITAITDPLPEFLAGVGVRARDIRVNLDRPEWALNPTSCEASQVSVTAHGNSGATEELSNRFQVGGCEALGFRPKLSAKLKGGTKRGDFPAMVSTLKMPSANQANIARAVVSLPKSEFLEQSHIRTICTRVAFAADACPKGSIYGRAVARTPLLEEPLTGNVYMRSSDHKLPDLVVALRGPASLPVQIDVVGRIDSAKGGGIRASFERVPDAPVSKFTLRMKGGGKGLLVNSRDICKGSRPRMSVRLIGHNGKRADQFPPLKAKCGKKGRKRGGKGRKR